MMCKYRYHADVKEEDFDTIAGLAVSKNLTYWSDRLNLNHVFGHAPQTYYLGRYPHTSQLSIFHLLLHKIFPAFIRRSDRPHPKPLMILNSGSARFDISAGPFTTDSQSLVFPFINRNLFVRDVPTHIAKKLLENMNYYGEYGRRTAEHWERAGQLDKLQQLDDETMHLRQRYQKLITWDKLKQNVSTTDGGRLSYG